MAQESTARELLAKLQAIRLNVAGWAEGGGRYFDPEVVLSLFDRYANARDSLRGQHPHLFHDLPVRPRPTPNRTTDYHGRGYIEVEAVHVLLSDIDYCIDLLSHGLVAEIPAMKVTQEGVFFAGQQFDALRRIVDILRQAGQSIVIVDAYVDESVLDLLTQKPQATRVNILTRDVLPALKTTALAFNKQYGGLSLRTSPAFHDRFVIIDGNDFYHFGASLKDAGNRGFMFSRIEEPSVVGALRPQLEAEWARATIVI